MAKTGIFKEAVLKGVFSLREGQTIYVRYGDYFVLLAFLFLAAFVARGIRKGRAQA